jgi:hypothetical protein
MMIITNLKNVKAFFVAVPNNIQALRIFVLSSFSDFIDDFIVQHIFLAVMFCFKDNVLRRQVFDKRGGKFRSDVSISSGTEEEIFQPFK